MKILYRQSKNKDNNLFYNENISNIFVKYLNYKNDSFSVNKKAHHHTCIEIHMIVNGAHTYEFDNKKITVNSGEMLLIPSLTKHSLTDYFENTEKFSITFNSDNPDFNEILTSPTIIKYPERILENLKFIHNEYNKRLRFSEQLVKNSVFEIIVNIFRLLGYTQKETIEASTEDNRLLLAKQFIKDNIELTPTITEIAKYCNLSTKQLTRLFKSEETTAMKYIHSQKIKIIQRLLIENKLTLKEIAVKFNFNNEYYFNAYFKKYAGMPPGEYRRMHNII